MQSLRSDNISFFEFFVVYIIEQ